MVVVSRLRDRKEGESGREQFSSHVPFYVLFPIFFLSENCCGHPAAIPLPRTTLKIREMIEFKQHPRKILFFLVK